MSHSAFFYGTLMAPPVLHRVIWGPSSTISSSTAPTPTPNPPPHASPLLIRPAVLPGYRRHRVRGADYPAIVPCSDDGKSEGDGKSETSDHAAAVRGTLVQGLTDGDIWRLDIFEGGEYKREIDKSTWRSGWDS